MADLVAGFFGSRGQGKSTQVHYLLRQLAAPRLLVFDPMDEYGDDAQRVPTLAELGKRTAAQAFKLRYVPPRDDQKPTIARFDAFCSLAYARGNLVMVVEELQLVTRASYAPPAWSDCTLRGRHRGLRIIGVSQRPASVDKNFFSCCSMVSTGRLNYDDDQRCMANVLGVPLGRVASLPRYQFFSRDMDTGTVLHGSTDDMVPGPKTAKKRPPAAKKQK